MSIVESSLPIATNSSNPDTNLIESIFDGCDVGLAIFDSDYSLLKCNDHYRHLCGYNRTDLLPGTKLETLIELTLIAQGTESLTAQRSARNTILTIEHKPSHTFRIVTKDGKSIEVCRRKVGEILVETVKEVTDHTTEISAHNKLEQFATTVRDRMSHAMNAMADGFALYDREDRLSFYNAKYVDLNPHIKDLIMPGAKFEDMLREGVERGGFNLNGANKEQFIQWRIQEHLNPSDPYEVELEDGRWILINEKKTHDGGIVGTRSDITEMKKRELHIQKISWELKERNFHFDTALNNMIQGLCMFDEHQRLIVCNKQYLVMYGFSDEVVKPGIKIREIMEYSVSLGNYSAEEAEQALSERPDPDRLNKRSTIKQRLKDGRVIAVMNEPMTNGGTIATYQDITQLENHEKKLVDYTKKLERSNKELQDFAHVASHDLQEPLRKIEAFGSRLVKKYGDTLPDDGKMFVDRMQNAAFRMRVLINDLLSYSRVTTKANPFKQLDPNKILADVLSDMQVSIEESGAVISADKLPEFDGDPVQIRQLFQNIVSNSIKYRKPDVAPEINIESKLVRNQTEDALSKNNVVIAFTDNGIGFEEEYKEKIFTIFQRLHGRLEYEGTGIGLATCRKIIDRHNGEIRATGEPNVGSKFVIQLPQYQTNHSEA